MAIRESPLAEVKILSLAALLYTARDADSITGNETTQAEVKKYLDQLRNGLVGKDPSALQSSNLFKTVGLARQVRIDDDWGTQPIYGIGAPTRPRLVPNNYSASVICDRLQLDTRDLSHYITTPDYWYSDAIQRELGIDDILLYTYLFVRSREDSGSNKRFDIYALMPRSASTAISSGDAMIVHNVSLTGYKYTRKELLFDLSNLVSDSITTTLNFSNPDAPTGGSNSATQRVAQ